MPFLKSLLQDGEDGTWSSKRVITFLAFVFFSFAFFANLLYGKKVDDTMLEGMMYIVLGGLGVTVTERFANKTNIPSQPQYRESINNRRIHGTPLPKLPEKEI
jgi:hypothetical protein